MQTQWRISATGARTGLDYAGVQAWLTSGAGLRGSERKDVFTGICAAERASLDVWHQLAQQR